MMNFDEFLEATRSRVQEELPDTEVKIQQVNKLQGESYVGISVQPEGAAAAATFNIGPAFERYQADPSQESAICGRRAFIVSVPTIARIKRNQEVMKPS